MYLEFTARDKDRLPLVFTCNVDSCQSQQGKWNQKSRGIIGRVSIICKAFLYPRINNRISLIHSTSKEGRC